MDDANQSVDVESAQLGIEFETCRPCIEPVQDLSRYVEQKRLAVVHFSILCRRKNSGDLPEQSDLQSQREWCCSQTEMCQKRARESCRSRLAMPC